MKTILCPVDFSPSSKLASEWAAMIAIKRNWTLVLLNSFRVSSEENKSRHPDSDNLFIDAEKDTQEKLLNLKNELCRKYNAENMKCNIFSEYGIETDSVILRSAKKANADMIVMGTEGAGDFKDVIWGSNTTHVINQAKIPVLVVPATAEAKLPETIIYATDLIHEDDHMLSFLLDFSFDIDAKVICLHINKEKDAKGLSRLKEVISNHISQSVNKGKESKLSFDEIESDNLFASLQGYAISKKAGLITLGHHQKNFFEKMLKGDLTRLMALFSSIPSLIFQKKE
jgi:nucleotide-binding universal stress UspA family protein